MDWRTQFKQNTPPSTAAICAERQKPGKRSDLKWIWIWLWLWQWLFPGPPIRAEPQKSLS